MLKQVQYCSDECRIKAWNSFHKFECKVLDHFYEERYQFISSQLLLAFRTTAQAAFDDDNKGSLDLNKIFVQMHQNPHNLFPDIYPLKKYEPSDYKTVFGLKNHCQDVPATTNYRSTIFSVFLAKCLGQSLSKLSLNFEVEQKELKIFASACLHHLQITNCNAYEIVENIRNKENKIFDPRNFGGAIYSSVSLTNHSCYPNIVRHTYPNGKKVG